MKPVLRGMLMQEIVDKYGKEIVDKYVKEKMTINKIAEYYQCSTSVIFKAICLYAGVELPSVLKRKKKKKRPKNKENPKSSPYIKIKSGRKCRICGADTGANYFYCDSCWVKVRQREGAWWDGIAIPE